MQLRRRKALATFWRNCRSCFPKRLHRISRLASVKLRITFSISVYIKCVMFIQRFESRGGRFTNFHYYYFHLLCWATTFRLEGWPCVLYFCVFKLYYNCQCLGVVSTWAQMLMYTFAHRGCTRTVRVSSKYFLIFVIPSCNCSHTHVLDNALISPN